MDACERLARGFRNAMNVSSPPRSFLKQLVRPTKHWFEDLSIFIFTLVSNVPIHAFRLAIYRLAGIQIGHGTSFHWKARFFQPSKLKIGRNSIIGNDAMLDARNGITIGDNVSLSNGCLDLEHGT